MDKKAKAEATERFGETRMVDVERNIRERFGAVSVTLIPSQKALDLVPPVVLALLKNDPDWVLDGSAPTPAGVLGLPTAFPFWLAVGFGERSVSEVADFCGVKVNVGFSPTMTGALFALTVGSDLLDSQTANEKGRLQ
jgi:hypothetical protein